MKVKVNKDACIGCCACVAICDCVFEINDEGLSEVKKIVNDEIKEEDKIACKDAAEACPTGAIEITEESEVIEGTEK